MGGIKGGKKVEGKENFVEVSNRITYTATISTGQVRVQFKQLSDRSSGLGPELSSLPVRNDILATTDHKDILRAYLLPSTVLKA